jgi:hypothetical protein
MKLQPNETNLIGKWIAAGNTMKGDIVCERIEWLVKNHLKLIAHSKQWGAWETLFQDPDDNRFWERTYPNGDMQGGGSPQLTFVPPQQARAKYPIG